jgi:phosphoadenosine phosphosulfate reductase
LITAKVFEKRIRTAFGPSADPEAPATSSADASLDLQLNHRVAAIRHIVSGRVVFTTSFGIEDQAMRSSARGSPSTWWPSIPAGCFRRPSSSGHRQSTDTAGAFSPLIPIAPGLKPLVTHQGVNGFYASVEARHACCAVRKVEPLRRALAGAVAWITGLRADQSDARVGASFAIVAPRHRLIEINPLFDWSCEQVVAFIREHDIPYHIFHDRGFVSIGCAPCTRAVAPGEPERAGRWWWEQEPTIERGPHDCHGARAPASQPSPLSPQETTP